MFGGFYTGSLDRFLWTGAWNPKPLVTVEFSGERNIGRLATGRFTQTLVGTRLRINISSDLSVSSYVQYDTDTEWVGTNTRLRWTFTPVADLFLVYNHNVRSIARSVAPRLQSAAGQTAVRVAALTADTVFQ